jgi:hypothetical protein
VTFIVSFFTGLDIAVLEIVVCRVMFGSRCKLGDYTKHELTQNPLKPMDKLIPHINWLFLFTFFLPTLMDFNFEIILHK